MFTKIGNKGLTCQQKIVAKNVVSDIQLLLPVLLHERFFSTFVCVDKKVQLARKKAILIENITYLDVEYLLHYIKIIKLDFSLCPTFPKNVWHFPLSKINLSYSSFRFAAAHIDTSS